MDEYALQEALEAMAGNAFSPETANNGRQWEAISETIARWHRLFDMPEDEAVDRIMEHRNDLTRTRVSDDHWSRIRHERKAQGYDREAYEYEIELQKKKATLPEMLLASDSSALTYLVELKGTIDSPDKIQAIAGMKELPLVVSGKSLEEGRPVWLCCIDSIAKKALLHWAASEGGGFEPTILVNPKSLQ